jgi:hypothetical protein
MSNSKERTGHAAIVVPASLPRDVQSAVLAAFSSHDVMTMIRLLPGGAWLPFVADNVAALKHRGMFEKSLLFAYTWGTYSPEQFDAGRLRELFALCNRKKLLRLGSPLPPQATITLWRGAREMNDPRGVSWTDNLNFACRFALWNDPSSDVAARMSVPAHCAVYRAEIPIADVVCRCQSAAMPELSEYIVVTRATVTNLRLSDAEIVTRTIQHFENSCEALRKVGSPLLPERQGDLAAARALLAELEPVAATA